MNTQSRSTWACELKSKPVVKVEVEMKGHAPRERVSWNAFKQPYLLRRGVTLHVSVWVEIHHSVLLFYRHTVTLHVSVWVEINGVGKTSIIDRSRSTWACELKCPCGYPHTPLICHAPRERVSWNSASTRCVTTELHVTLHVSVWVEIELFMCCLGNGIVTLHVSVWVEMKK